MALLEHRVEDLIKNDSWRGEVMLQSRERTDSYAAMGGRFVQKFHFMCISSGFPELLRSDMNGDRVPADGCGIVWR